MKTTAVATDPVCGMSIDTVTASEHTEHSGEIFYFCSARCKTDFERDPGKYLGKSPNAPKAGHSCCG